MYNSHAIEKVLAGLYLDNDLIISNEYPLRLEDFVEKKYQAIYTALYNLYALGNSHIDINDIVAYFREQQGMYEKFISDGGMDILYQVCADDSPLNFDYNYSLMKKQSLLRDFAKIGVDVSDLWDKTLAPELFEKQIHIDDNFSIPLCIGAVLFAASFLPCMQESRAEKFQRQIKKNQTAVESASDKISDAADSAVDDVSKSIKKGWKNLTD